METKSSQPPYPVGTWTDENGHIHYVVLPQGTKSKNITQAEANANKIIDDYFSRLDKEVTALLPHVKAPIKATLQLWTADGETMLEFGTGDEIQEATNITEGTPVKLADGGKVEDGEYLLPNTTKIEVKDGKVTKVTPATPQQIAAKIHQDMANFKNEIRAFVCRKPYQAKRQPSGKCKPFHAKLTVNKQS